MVLAVFLYHRSSEPFFWYAIPVCVGDLLGQLAQALRHDTGPAVQIVGVAAVPMPPPNVPQAQEGHAGPLSHHAGDHHAGSAVLPDRVRLSGPFAVDGL